MNIPVFNGVAVLNPHLKAIRSLDGKTWYLIDRETGACLMDTGGQYGCAFPSLAAVVAEANFRITHGSYRV